MKKQKILIITINYNEYNQRIDNFLLKKYKKIPKGKIYKILRKGEVRVNKKRVKPKYKLQYKDIIRIPPLKINFFKKNKIKINQKIQKKIIKNIIYEDKNFLVINKPSGIAVHSGSGINFGIIEILRYKKSKNFFIELIHRIDKNTSGVLMLAKKRSILKKIHKQFFFKRIKKKYIILVHGTWPKEIKCVDQPIKKKKSQKNKKLVFICKKGKKSKTYFNIIKNFKKYTLLYAYPITGRTHQIRIHAAYIGHPIVFDERYGNYKKDSLFKIPKKNKNILLHSYKITFKYPETKKKITIKANLKKKFLDILDII